MKLFSKLLLLTLLPGALGLGVVSTISLLGAPTVGQRVLLLVVVGLPLFLCAAIATRAVLKPVRQLSKAWARLAGGDREVRFPESPGQDALAGLGRSFNELADKLQNARTDGALSQSDATFRQLAETIDAVFWLANLKKDKLFYVSPAGETIFGLPCERLYEEPERLLQICHPEDREKLSHSLIDQGGLAEHEYRITRPDGTELWVRTRTFPVCDAQGAPYHLAGITEDITKEKQVAGELRASEKRYRDLVELSHDLIWSVDARGFWTFVNRTGALQIYGYEPAEMLGKPFVDFLWPSVVERDMQTLRKIKSGQKLLNFPTVHRRKDGRKVHLSFNASVVRDDTGKVLGVAGTARDMSSEIESKERYRVLTENAPEAIVLLDVVSDRFIEVNENAVKLFRMPREQLLRSGPKDVSPALQPDGRPSSQLAAEAVAAVMRGTTQVFEWMHRDAEGREVLCEVRLNLMPYEGRQLVRGSVTDITERKLAEEAVRASEQNLSITLDSIGDAVIASDAAGVVTRINPVAERLVGWSKADVLGQPLEHVFRLRATETALDLENPVRQVMRSGQLVAPHEHAVLVSRDGSESLVSYRGSPISRGRDVLGVVLVFRDVTEEQAIQRHLRQVQKLEAIGRLAGGIAHDFNNLLCGIMGYAELLYRSLEASDPEQAGFAHTIIKTSQRASELTRQLLAFSRKGPLQSRPVDMHEVVQEVITLAERIIDRRIEIETLLQADSAQVTGDPSQLQNAVLNLVVNARDAMPEGGKLRIATRSLALSEADCRDKLSGLEPGPHVELSVSDTGVGISAPIIDHIFEPFYTTKGVGKGTGLGLSVVYGTLQAHRGKILVESQPGEGSCFRMVLPVSDAEAVERRPSDERALSGHGCILLVDDEEVVRTMAGRLLRELGYTVRIACDGPEALEIYREQGAEIDLVLLDMVMPKLNGRETLRALRELDPEVRVLIATGYDVEAEGDPIFEHGVIDKPFEMNELARRITELLGGGRSDTFPTPLQA